MYTTESASLLQPFWNCGLEVVAFSDMLMCDWDYKQQQVRCVDDAVLRLKKLGLALPSLTWAVYETPAGVHAFEVTRSWKVDCVSLALMRYMKCCFGYIRMTEKHGVWRCRIGKKPDRPNDFIARFVKVVGKADARWRAAKLLWEHDDLIHQRLHQTVMT